ncbi:ATP-dependent Clp protease ATP-binding subunit [bacterium]|nr:ATP-dependent Clp protease ATP-binding subunit [bacterium]
MDITTLSIPTKNALANEYRARGYAVLPAIELPSSFDPPETDVVLLDCRETCEVHIGVNTTYTGTCPIWQEIQNRPEGPGRTRFATSVQGDFFSGVAALRRLLDEAQRAEQSAGVPHATTIDAAPAVDLRHGMVNGTSASHPLTDMSAVREAIRDSDAPLYFDGDELFNLLRVRVLGQEHALRSLAGVLARHSARRHATRPAVVFATGPSGVGKTHTAEVLPSVLRRPDNEEQVYQYLRLDMNEYQESHRVSQLIGAPQGYVGHGEGAQLVNALRANPRTIVLFDEIEKAHPAILQVLMNAMDAGRLSTAAASDHEHTVDCRQSIFMFTSNVGSAQILDELESRKAFGQRPVEDEICRRRLRAGGLASEIIGRIGRFLVYRPLDLATRAEIVAMEIAEVAEEYGLKVEHVAPEVVVSLMHPTGSDHFGVRPNRYLIDEALGLVFAEKARQHPSGPVEIVGPPYQCRPLDDDKTPDLNAADSVTLDPPERGEN